MHPRFVGVVMLSEPFEPSAAAIVDQLAADFPMMEPADVTAQSKTPENGMMIAVGGAAVTIRLMDGPMPPKRLDRAIKTSLGWPGAAEAAATHKSHIIVAPILETTPDKAVSLAAITTAATAAIASVCPAMGIYWANADHLISLQAFEQAAQKAVNGATPMTTWVKFMPVRGDQPEGQPEGSESATGFITAGFASFTDREIQMAPLARPRPEIGAMMVGFMNHIVRNQVDIPDGGRVGVNNVGTLLVNLQDNNRYTGAPVYHLQLEGEIAKAMPSAAAAPRPAPQPAPPPAPQPSPAAQPAPAPEPMAAASPPPVEDPVAGSADEKSGGMFGRLFGKKK